MTPSEAQIVEAVETEEGLTTKQLYNTIKPDYTYSIFRELLKKLSYKDKKIKRTFKKHYKGIQAKYFKMKAP